MAPPTVFHRESFYQEETYFRNDLCDLYVKKIPGLTEVWVIEGQRGVYMATANGKTDQVNYWVKDRPEITESLDLAIVQMLERFRDN